MQLYCDAHAKYVWLSGQILEIAEDETGPIVNMLGSLLEKAKSIKGTQLIPLAERRRASGPPLPRLTSVQEQIYRRALEELAEHDCAYGDSCPDFGTRHGRCVGCVARSALAAARGQRAPEAPPIHERDAPTATETATGVCKRCVCACDCCLDRVRGRLVPSPTEALPHESDIDNRTKDGCGIIDLPYTPTDDPELTCLVCGNMPCAFEIRTRSGGSTKFTGLCATCRAGFVMRSTSRLDLLEEGIRQLDARVRALEDARLK